MVKLVTKLTQATSRERRSNLGEFHLQTHSLMPFVFSFRRLKRAARQCMGRASSPGIDSVSWKMYRGNLDANISNLRQKLAEGSWVPTPCRQVLIQSFTGKDFLIAIPTIEDRIVHRAVRNTLEPILEHYAFFDFVSGYRFGRSRITSVRQAAYYIENNFKYVADVDIKNVSGNISSKDLREYCAQWISDKTFLHLVETILDGLPSPIAPGGGLSPLMINLRLTNVDACLCDKAIVRFADNYCIFCKTKSDAVEAYEFISQCLEKFNLSISSEKSKIWNQVNPEDLFLIAG